MATWLITILSTAAGVIGTIVGVLQLRRTPASRERNPRLGAQHRAEREAIRTNQARSDNSGLPRSQRSRQPTYGRTVRLAPRPAYLAGREELLTTVHKRLTGSGMQWPRTVVLCGLGGVGKTSVAVEYAHRHLDEYGLVWQFAAEETTTLSAGFAELARLLIGANELFAIDPVIQVHGALAARDDEWLLIFDNATDADAVRAVLPPIGRGSVLITSQSPHWPIEQAIEVPVLEQQV